LISFAKIFSVSDRRPVRLQPMWTETPHIDVAPDLVSEIIAAKFSLPDNLKALPLRLPVSCKSLLSYCEEIELVRSDLGGVEFGIGPAPDDWKTCTNAKVWSALSSAGASLTMLEFGVGYSSLSRLPFLPFSKIEIGAHLVEESHGSAFVSTIGSLARGLGLTVCARLPDSGHPPADLEEHGVSEYVFIPKLYVPSDA
jgi:hypothetical protein